MAAAPAHADVTDSVPLLTGTWVFTDPTSAPWWRVVFDGSGQGFYEYKRSSDESTEPSWERDEGGCDTEPADFKGVTGSWRSYTGLGIWSCGTEGGYPTIWTRAEFDIGLDGDSLTLAITYMNRDDTPMITYRFARQVEAAPPPPDGSPPPPPAEPQGVTCGAGGSAFTMRWQQAFDLVDTAAAAGVFDQAQLAVIESDPCVLSQLSFGGPTATTVAEYQVSEPVAGSAARTWRCATFNVTWPIRGPFAELAPIGTVETTTDACTDGRTLKGGDPTRADPPVASSPDVTLHEPYNSLWSHSPAGGPTGRFTDEGTAWEYRQVMQYAFLHYPAGADDIVYTFTLGLPVVPDGPPFLHFAEPK